jgi:FAD/FMN-containing dehydrogenase
MSISLALASLGCTKIVVVVEVVVLPSDEMEVFVVSISFSTEVQETRRNKISNNEIFFFIYTY